MTTLVPNTETALTTLRYYAANLTCSESIADFFAPDVELSHTRVAYGSNKETTVTQTKEKVMKEFQDKLLSKAQDVTLRNLTMKVYGWTAKIDLNAEYNRKEENGSLKRYAFVDKTYIEFDPTSYKINKIVSQVEKFALAPSTEKNVTTYLNTNNFIQNFVRGRAEEYKNSLAENVEWKWDRLKGGMCTAHIDLAGKNAFFNLYNAGTFAITDGFYIRGIDITVEGSSARAVFDISENKKYEKGTARVHMICDETLEFDDDNKIAKLYSSNSSQVIPDNAN